MSVKVWVVLEVVVGSFLMGCFMLLNLVVIL